jgi:hypothetical protein
VGEPGGHEVVRAALGLRLDFIRGDAEFDGFLGGDPGHGKVFQYGPLDRTGGAVAVHPALDADDLSPGSTGHESHNGGGTVRLIQVRALLRADAPPCRVGEGDMPVREREGLQCFSLRDGLGGCRRCPPVKSCGLALDGEYRAALRSC